MMQRFILFLTSFLIVLSSCKKDPTNPVPQNNYVSLEIPYYIPAMPEVIDNPLSLEGIELGKQLYHDVQLSSGGPLDGHACSSCHIQEKGFASDMSAGLSVLPHANLAWQGHFLWNGSFQGNLEEVMEMEIADFFQSDLSGIKSQTRYADLYAKAFGDPEINLERSYKAMAQYVRSLISFNAPFDKYLRGDEPFPDLVYDGFIIYNSEKGDCFHCHTLGLFTDADFHNNGIDSVFTGYDQGYMLVSNNSADIGKFKTPSLRNVALRASYMHDGRFKSLEEVIDHYNEGVKNSLSLDPIMTKAGKENGLQLTPYEKAALKAFLESLTDETFINNLEHSP